MSKADDEAIFRSIIFLTKIKNIFVRKERNDSRTCSVYEVYLTYHIVVGHIVFCVSCFCEKSELLVSFCTSFCVPHGDFFMCHLI